jgi:hypothetical protein
LLAKILKTLERNALLGEKLIINGEILGRSEDLGYLCSKLEMKG